MTDTPRRPTLIPRWLRIVAVGVVLLLVAVMVSLLLTRPVPVTIPSVEGLDAPVARSRLAQAGLLMAYGDSRFSSDIPEGGVLEQEPAAGTQVLPGSTVSIVVSAGSDTIVLPDLLGTSADSARVQLESRGLVVEFEAIPADASPGTVIGMSPAPATEVRSGSLVRLTVAGDIGADALLPSDLSGVVVVLDPAPPKPGQADTAMEITRHVRSLLEASKADVLVTRSIVETTAPAAVRAAWSAESSPTIVLGISMGGRGSGERLVYFLPASPQRTSTYLASVELARLVVNRLQDLEEDVSTTLPREDAVLDAGAAPGVRLLLGDPADPENIERFADPAWVDRFSRALYRALVAAVIE